MTVSVFSWVIFGLIWFVLLRFRLFWSVLVNCDTGLSWNPGLGFGKNKVYQKWQNLYSTIQYNMATGIRYRLLFRHLRTSLIDLSDLKISYENSECVIGISHIEFDLTYSLPHSELLRSFESTYFAGRAKLAITRHLRRPKFFNILRQGVIVDCTFSLLPNDTENYAWACLKRVKKPVLCIQIWANHLGFPNSKQPVAAGFICCTLIAFLSN